LAGDCFALLAMTRVRGSAYPLFLSAVAIALIVS